MGSTPLDSLKIDKVPACFYEFAKAHNALCDYIGSFSGGDGLKVIHAPPTPGTAARGGGGKMHVHFAHPSDSTAVSPGSVAYVASGIDGKLVPTRAIPGHRPTVYPAFIQVGESGDLNTSITPNSVVVVDPSTGAFSLMDTDGFSYEAGPFGFLVTEFGGLVQVTNATTGKSLTIDYSLLTQDVSLREIHVCDSGVAKKMLVLASDPY